MIYSEFFLHLSVSDLSTADREDTIWGLLEARSREQPDSPAIVCEERVTSYAQLTERAQRVAAGLRALGVGPGDRIALLDFNTERYFEIYYGAAALRAVTVGVNVRLAAPEVEYILNDAGAQVLFVGEEQTHLAETLEPALADLTIIAMNGGHGRWPNYDEWRDKHRPITDLDQGQPQDEIVQLYTSGTTGHPKGACHTNEGYALARRACQAAGWADYTSQTVKLVTAPAFHVAGFNNATHTLSSGGRIVLLPKVDPGGIIQAINDHRVTHTLMVPAVIQMVLNHPEAKSADFSSLEYVSYGAAPMAETVLARAQKLFGCGFVHLYGQTENLGVSTNLPANRHDPALGKLRSVGIPYPGADLKIVDPDGDEVAPGVVGEIVFRAPWVMRGYWNNDAATAETVVDGWLHSGDAGYRDEDGYLYIHDRVKDMIITGGENVYPAEVENALFAHPSIADAAVIGVPDDKWGEAVKAFIVLKDGAALDSDDIRSQVRERIAGYKVPKSFEVLDELPRNASGKVLRRELRAPYWPDQLRPTS